MHRPDHPNALKLRNIGLPSSARVPAAKVPDRPTFDCFGIISGPALRAKQLPADHRAHDDGNSDYGRPSMDRDVILRYALGGVFVLLIAAGVIGILFGLGNSGALVSVTSLAILALVLIAALPLMVSFELSFKGLKAKLRDLGITVKDQGDAISKQQEIINDLVVYSLATQPYEILRALKTQKEYIYHDSENNRRWANVLLDNGFIEPKPPETWLQFDTGYNQRNLVDIAKPTPAGEFLVDQREKRVTGVSPETTSPIAQTDRKPSRAKR
jgi:hypothetical protein